VKGITVVLSDGGWSEPVVHTTWHVDGSVHIDLGRHQDAQSEGLAEALLTAGWQD
jgi:hypothetical protein